MTLKDKVIKKLDYCANQIEDDFTFIIKHRFRKYCVAISRININEYSIFILDDEGNGVEFYE